MGLMQAISSKSYCQNLFQFHEWRVGKISAMLSKMNGETLAQQINGSFSSVNVILYHIVWAEKLWLGRVNHNEVAAMKDSDTEGLLAEWKHTVQKWKQLLESLPEAGFEATHAYHNTQGDRFENSLFEICLHLTDHSTYHIGQMMSAIRSLGQEPVQTNYIHYLRDTKRD